MSNIINKNSVFIPFVMLIVVLSSFIGNMCAQQLPFRNIGINEGLPSTEVYSILQDDEGYIWCSSDAGVARFNGNTFTTFNAKNGLTDNTIFQLYKDPKGRIWMPCFNGTACYYDHGKIKGINANKKLSAEMQGSIYLIQSLCIGPNDTLAVGTTHSVFKIPPVNNYNDIIAINDTTNWLGLEQFGNGLISYSNVAIKKSGKSIDMGIKFNLKGRISYEKIIFEKTGRANPRFCAILTSNKNILFSQDENLYLKNEKNIIALQTFNKYIISIYEDAKHGIWIGLSKGGVYYYPDWDFSRKPYHFLDDNSISGILVDSENGIWLSTLEKGIFYAPFFNYWNYTDNGLKEKITGLYTFHDNIYVANYKNEIYKINKHGVVKEIEHEKGSASSNLSFFYEVRDALYFCGAKSCSILPNDQCQYFKDSTGAYPTLVSVLEYSADKFIATSYSDYHYINKNHELLAPYLRLPSRASSMLAKNEKEYWVGTNKGLYVLHENEFSQSEIPAELLETRITHLKKDNFNNVLVCTRTQGLFILNGNTWQHISEKQGLPSDLINHLVVEKNNRIWLATNKGLAFFTINKNGKLVSPVISLTIANGLPTNEISALAIRQQELFIGTRNGLSKILLDKLFYQASTTTPRISSIHVRDTPLEKGETSLSYNDNSIRFYIDCNTYKDAFVTKYYYRLKGFDTTLKLSQTPFIEFLSLPAGSYTFEVYPYLNGHAGKNKSSFSFTILNPWYFTWWFITLVTVFIIALVYVFVLFRIRTIKRREEEKTKINKQLAEFQLTALQAQMNPHFIFNAITSIQNYILKKKEIEAYDYLAKFSKLIRMVLNNSETKILSLEEEMETVKLYVELEQLRFKNNFDFTVNMSERIDAHQVQIPSMMIQPYVENAIWHGLMNLDDERKGKLSISITSNHTTLNILIEDNGVGRKKSAEYKKESLHKPMAMKLSEQRLMVINSMHEYASATVKVSDLKSTYGTRVEITLPI